MGILILIVGGGADHILDKLGMKEWRGRAFYLIAPETDTVENPDSGVRSSFPRVSILGLASGDER